jgi:hypothetical protein
MAKDIGIITEQGDLGFGFDKLNESDSKVYAEATKSEQQPKTEVVNENNK